MLEERFIYLTEGDQYFDTFKRRFCKPKEIDTMYLRSRELLSVRPKTTATDFLQRCNIPFVDKITFQQENHLRLISIRPDILTGMYHLTF